MKKNIIILLVAVALFGGACSDFLSVNEENPNNPSKVAAKLVLPAAINTVTNTMNNPRRFDFVYLWHGLWSVSAGYSQPQNLVQYKLTNTDYQNGFRELYIAAGNFDMIEKTTTDPKDVYYVAISKIMKAYIFQNIVDCWGDVPYSEAFKASSGNLKPKYQGQQSIYEDLVVQLDAAIGLIQSAPADANAVPSSSDIMYSGDMQLWAKFANTVKLRILVHQADMPGRTTYITDAIATTASVGYLEAGEGALVNPGYLVSDGKMNPFYAYFYNAAGSSNSDGVTYYFAGKDAIEFMKETNDARIGKFFLPYSGTSFNGNIVGTDPDDLSSQALTSRLGYIKDEPTTMIGTAKKSSPILTDFESLFVQAEAAQRNLISADAKKLYESAVNQSFSYMGVSAADAGAFLTQISNKANYDNALNPLELILTQKWIALNGIAPVEIWTDYRRTGFPSFLHFSPDVNRQGPGYPPVRLLYPQDELNVNNDNVLAVGTINAFTSKIFWQTR